MPNKEEKRAHNCRGCFDFQDCEKVSKPSALQSTPVKRVTSGQKYFICHSLQTVERPADPKKTRRQFGETAVQY